MSPLFITLLYVLLIGSLCIVPFSLPGNWLMVGVVALFAWFFPLNPGGSDMMVIVVVVLLAGLGELIDFLVNIVGNKKAHVPNGAIVFAMIGGLIGAILGVPVFLVGSLLGLLLGIFLGGFVYGYFIRPAGVQHAAPLQNALALAWQVTKSQAIALFAKTCVGLVIIVYMSFVVF
jgi:uncharacterized protein